MSKICHVTKIAGYAEVLKIPAKLIIIFTECYNTVKVDSTKHEKPYPRNISQGRLQSWEYPACLAKIVVSCRLLTLEQDLLALRAGKVSVWCPLLLPTICF